ncbi:hypothetical protein AN168_08950 [Vibrio splendidus]|uniref:Uncharacterized protein n=1 Tax=Vibrio splendidus TaxID=29497 RepID=A0A837NV47_VIBSP|nr:hypothetical protein AN168_08950 [Vibrio splendidus]
MSNYQIYIAIAFIWVCLIVLKCSLSKKFPDHNVFSKSIFATLSLYSVYGVIKVTEILLNQNEKFSNDLIMPMFVATAVTVVGTFFALKDLFSKSC